MASQSTCVLVPLKADAFVLNEKCCDQNEFKIAPLVQPNYAFLRLKNHILESDIQDHADLHAAKPPASNQRIYDIGSGKLRRNRLGVYVHWVLPPFYRLGTGFTSEAHEADRSRSEGPENENRPKLEGSVKDPSVPTYRPVPNRWLVTRRLAAGSYEPRDAKIPEYESWVVQSDAMRKLSTDKSLGDLDLEVDVSPLVNPNVVQADDKLKQDIINGQGEVFVGKKTRIEDYRMKAADNEPSVDLHIMTSGNPLLADYQPHNANIFSILDNFAYKDGETTKYLERAQADYSIIGWHSKPEAEPLLDCSKDKKQTSSDRLKACNMAIKDFNEDAYDPKDPSNLPWWENAAAFLKEKGNTATTLCHSAMYQVKYGPDLPKKVQARDASPPNQDALFAVGTSDLDALISFFSAKADALPWNSEVARDLRRLVNILGENGDGDIDGIQKYSDEVYKHSFRKIDAGVHWSWQTDGSRAPSGEEKTNLDKLNQAQKMMDTLKREEQDLQWQIFAIWWTWTSSVAVKEKTDYYKPLLDSLIKRLVSIRSQSTHLGPAEEGEITAELRGRFEKLFAEALHTKSTADRFLQRRDPTLLFTKIGSGWEADFSDRVQVRRHEQAVKVHRSDVEAVKACTELKRYAQEVPEAARVGVEALLEEFRAIDPETGDRRPIINDEVLPFFVKTNRDVWLDTQPWRPLFIEWEALYYEVPFDKWQCVDHPKANKYGASAIEYVVEEDVSKMFDPKAPGAESTSRNVLRIAGRNYLQPQADATFKTLIGPVFDNTSAEVLLRDFGVRKDQKNQFLAMVNDMQFVSASMKSVTDSLLTIRSGSHLTPLVSLPDSTPVALADAAATIKPICPYWWNPTEVIQLAGRGSGPTPFASSVPMHQDHYPLRPLQQGQLQFIKLNIVDKFGQALHFVDPRPPRNGKFYTVCPIVSDSLAPNIIKDGDGTTRPNIPIRQDAKAANPFVCLPPAINQPSRINAAFVQKVERPGPWWSDSSWEWRRCADWDNPVWGWVVVNYADSGIQFFLQDGRFYREIRFGTQAGTSLSYKFLPFEPPRDPATGGIATAKTAQLDFLIEKLSDAEYMLAFWDMINASFDSSAFEHAPTTYSTFTSAVIGKPLALVNAGWSLELSEPPKKNWTTSDVRNPDLKPPRTLLNPDPEKRWAERQWPPPTQKDLDEGKVTDSQKRGFTFPVKIGDASRRYDGLVGYFLPKDGPLDGKGSDLDLSRVFTFPQFISNKEKPGPRTAISPANYPRHTPYWFAPDRKGEDPDRHDDKLQVLGLLMDPFLPVHALSGILPTRPLQLPRWSVEQALKKMTAFWHAGPLLVTKDVNAKFDPQRLLTDDYIAALDKYASGAPLNSDSAPPSDETEALELEAADPPKNTLPAVQLPLAPPTAAANGAGAKFMYLQPYMEPVDEKEPEGRKRSRYNPYRVDGQAAAGLDAQEMKLAPGPYTALEGYIQIAKPLG